MDDAWCILAFFGGLGLLFAGFGLMIALVVKAGEKW